MPKSTLNQQLEFQQRVLMACGRDPNIYKGHAKVFWRNPTNHNSLRLTKFGLDFFAKELDIAIHSISLSDPLNYKHLIQLERLFTAPYFLKKGEIVVFSEQDAIMLQLHAGNLGQYLDNLQTNK